MTFPWTQRQFVGGALCLDFVNTVFYAEDPERRGDRLRTAEEIAAWLGAAERFGSAGAYRGMVAVAPESIDAGSAADLLLLRGAIDDLFRSVARRRPPPAQAYQRILFALAGALPALDLACGDRGLQPLAGDPGCAAARGAIAHSALNLAQSPLLSRVKSCPKCNWLFVDRSRNGSRVWCDMQTCGNRAKAQRYHEAHRPGTQTA